MVTTIITALALAATAIVLVGVLIGARRARPGDQQQVFHDVEGMYVGDIEDMIRDDTDRPDFQAHSSDTKADAAYHGWEAQR